MGTNLPATRQFHGDQCIVPHGCYDTCLEDSDNIRVGVLEFELELVDWRS
jgi:hypothetical protein